MRLLILVIIVTSILTSSCTIQKRTFRNGYYVSWNRSVKKDKTQPKDEVTAKNEQLAESTGSIDTICNADAKAKEERFVCEKTDTLQVMEGIHLNDSVIEKPIVQHAETAFIERLNDAVESVKEKKRLKKEAETLEKTPNLFAINSLVFSIGYVILSFITIYTSLFALAIISFLLALSLAIVAIVKWKRNKGNFWGTFFAVIALGLLVLGTLILLLFIVAGSL
ncbi:hypothetical protein [Fluviicola taffensis]|uniref:hypothetical protein n=1 Tax=Fluviicola taffensis TaxID=191579 RepID=UPI003137BEF8